VREVVRASGDRRRCATVYNACVDGVQRFRALHLEYAALYIYKQQAKDAKNPTRVGTGGTPFMKYLKKHRDESGAHRLE
jgi:indoleamine 2,3-dioxygenase